LLDVVLVMVKAGSGSESGIDRIVWVAKAFRNIFCSMELRLFMCFVHSMACERYGCCILPQDAERLNLGISLDQTFASGGISSFGVS
jgi:hypothetical protein